MRVFVFATEVPTRCICSVLYECVWTWWPNNLSCDKNTKKNKAHTDSINKASTWKIIRWKAVISWDFVYIFG